MSTGAKVGAGAEAAARACRWWRSRAGTKGRASLHAFRWILRCRRWLGAVAWRLLTQRLEQKTLPKVDGDPDVAQDRWLWYRTLHPPLQVLGACGGRDMLVLDLDAGFALVLRQRVWLHDLQSGNILSKDPVGMARRMESPVFIGALFSRPGRCLCGRTRRRRSGGFLRLVS
jgi:hypothetical protein